jgi:predicted ATPase/class 3 adenylate cyclase
MIASVEHPPTDTVSFLFTDVEGSTRLWERYPDAMRDALARHDALLRTAIEGSGGHIVKTTGDGMMAVFQAAPEAVSATVAAQRTLATGPWPETGPLRVRMGIHAGQADRRADDYFGPAVNRTARIMAAGHGGQVLLSSAAVAEAGDRLPPLVTLRDLGEHRLKDLGRPEHVFQLVHPDLASTFPPLATLRPQASLPARTTELVGRQTELAAIRAMIVDEAVRLLTLTGPGGTGKTSLAIRAAEDLSSSFSDGVAFVDLSGSRDTDALLGAIARAVGLSEASDRPLVEDLTDRLRDRQVLLVLDNFEQVTEAASVVARLSQDCPQVTLLVTSREALHVRSERVLDVSPLGVPSARMAKPTAERIAGFESIRLFVERARLVRPDFALTDDNAAAVAEICRRLDGLPLAIELAAARLRLFTPEVLRERLDDRLGLLRSGERDLPARQQTLRAAMDWSYELLEPGEQRVFELLSVFAEADVVAIEHVAGEIGTVDGADLDVFEALTSLVEKSLVRQVEASSDASRVTMLETIRVFAADRLAGQPDFSARAQRAHATYYADLARRMRAELTGFERGRGLAAMTADVANLRLAWRHWVAAGEVAQLDKLADSLLIVNDAHGWYADIVTLTTDMLAVLDAGEATPERTGQVIALRTSLARALMATKGFTPEVEEAFTSALELFEGANARQQFSVLRGLTSLYQFRGDFVAASRLGNELLALAEREGEPRLLIEAHFVVGAVLMFVEDLRGGLDHLDQAIAMIESQPLYARSTRVGNDSRVSAYTTSGFTLWILGQPDQAIDRMRRGLDLAARLEHPPTSAYARFHAGLLRLWRGEPALAQDLATGLLDLAEEYDFRIWTAAGGVLLGAAQVAQGEHEPGLASIRDGLDRYRGLKSPPVFWPMLLYLNARANLQAGRPEAALASIDPAIQMMEASSVIAELQLFKGDVLAALPNRGTSAADDPASWYRRAIESATRWGARTSILRAALRLARIEDQPVARGDAVRLLRETLEAFTEGHDTPDLREAAEYLAHDALDSGNP